MCHFTIFDACYNEPVNSPANRAANKAFKKRYVEDPTRKSGYFPFVTPYKGTVGQKTGFLHIFKRKVSKIQSQKIIFNEFMGSNMYQTCFKALK